MTDDNVEDDTLTVEEAAYILKVNPATVQRELRAGRLPGNTVGRAWRIRRADLREYLKGPPARTEGERAFEMYLDSVDLRFAFEESIVGTTKRPDFRLTLDGETSLFEVKQFNPQPEDFRPGLGMNDPYPPLREKIDAARKKFKGLKGTASCSLVLYNNGKPLIFLDPHHVFGAMLGDVGWTFPIDTSTGVGDADRIQKAFLGRGKMVKYGKGGEKVAPWNTTISAIVVVSAFDVGRHWFAITVARREGALGRGLTFDEYWNMHELWTAAAADKRAPVVRVRVYENPFAAKPLSRAFGAGPWDERFGPDGDRLARVVVGSALRELEQEEEAAGIEVDPWRI